MPIPLGYPALLSSGSGTRANRIGGRSIYGRPEPYAERSRFGAPDTQGIDYPFMFQPIPIRDLHRPNLHFYPDIESDGLWVAEWHTADVLRPHAPFDRLARYDTDSDSVPDGVYYSPLYEVDHDYPVVIHMSPYTLVSSPIPAHIRDAAAALRYPPQSEQRKIISSSRSDTHRMT